VLSACVCVCVCVFSLKYPACKAHVPYSDLWSDSTIFFHIISSEKVTEYKMCVLVPLQLLSETFHILRIIERDMIKNVYGSLRTVPAIIVRFQ